MSASPFFSVISTGLRLRFDRPMDAIEIVFDERLLGPLDVLVEAARADPRNAPRLVQHGLDASGRRLLHQITSPDEETQSAAVFVDTGVLRSPYADVLIKLLTRLSDAWTQCSAALKPYMVRHMPMRVSQ
jgi:hypothetical protein